MAICLLTAVMFVTAPPMPTTASGLVVPRQSAQIGPDRRPGLPENLCRNGRVEVKALRVAHGSDVTLNRSTRGATAICELRGCRRRCRKRRLHRRSPAADFAARYARPLFLLAGHDLDFDARPSSGSHPPRPCRSRRSGSPPCQRPLSRRARRSASLTMSFDRVSPSDSSGR